MTSETREHYETLLADHYSWMFGDFDARVAADRAFFERLELWGPGRALDLGAGSGFQSLALAGLGFTVEAIDFSPKLVTELRRRAGSEPVVAIEADVSAFPDHVKPGFDVAVCMGDTLPHLESRERVRELFSKVSSALAPGGKFVLSFRDLSHELTGVDRVIPVRADDSTIFTCFLEYLPEHVRVTDAVYSKTSGAWKLAASSYLKLRLSKDDVAGWLRGAGFQILEAEMNRGRVALVGRR